MNLFQFGDFTLRSGAKSKWKIECDALTLEDWESLAAMAVERLSPFSRVYGVPRGGIPFADALRKYATVGPVLIAEDVCTTGGSMTRYVQELKLHMESCIGVCAFQRGPDVSWVTPVFKMFPPRETR